MPARGGFPDSLPIDDVLPAILAAFGEGRPVVVQAPPGAGKTTRVPLALLDASWLQGRRVMMLEPRRIAARAAARRMAAMLDEEVGATVGFRVRGEARVSRDTRIEVVTEGILTRVLQDDPTLDGIGVVLFDEFHERSIHADLGLALAIRSRALLREDLRIGIMSATLDTGAASRVLGEQTVTITSSGRACPVVVDHVPRRDGQRVEQAVVATILRSLQRGEGSILAFLPGAGEIRRVAELLADRVGPRVSVMPLFGDLPPTEQDRAIQPVPAGHTKVVLATSIAETSITIDGVRVVVDSGLARVPRFSLRSGMSRLETVRVTRASAEQRCGRAGRTSPGVCHRLWDAAEDAQLRDRNTPEILDGDLAPLALDLALAGVEDASELRWIDPPPAGALAQARELLRLLGAIDAAHRATAHGYAMARFGMHPRLAHMLVRAIELGMGATACVVAALLEERDVFRRDAANPDPDLRPRVALVGSSRDHDPRADAGVLRRVRAQAAAWRRMARVGDVAVDEARTGELVALAYPERVAMHRAGPGNRYLMRTGNGVRLADPGTLASSEFLAVADLDGRAPEAGVYLAAPMEAGDVDALFGSEVTEERTVTWDAASGSVVAWERRMLGALALAERRARVKEPAEAVAALIDAIRRHDSLELPWPASVLALRQRVAFAATLGGEWPDLSITTLLATMDGWLAPHLADARRRADVERLDLHEILRGLLDWKQRTLLDELAPAHVVVPTGSRIAIDYADPLAPSMSVRLQEMFGVSDTPRVAGGRVALTVRLLSPAHRPVQVTRDLAGFWRTAYFAVRKDLRARYPRHAWPEDPLGATPTKRAKPRS